MWEIIVVRLEINKKNIVIFFKFVEKYLFFQTVQGDIQAVRTAVMNIYFDLIFSFSLNVAKILLL